MRRAQNATESELIRSFQSVEHKADMLNEYSFYRGDPLAYKQELADLFRVTPADVKRVANQYLTAARVRVDVTPGEPTPRGPEPDVDRAAQAPLASPPLAAVKDSFDRSAMPKVGPPPLFTPPPVSRRTLSNGLELVVCERRALPILSIQLMCKGGENLVPAARDGLAALTASVLTEATTTLDSLALAGELSEIGAAIVSSGGLESTSVRITTLSRHRDRALGLFADVVLRPAFHEKDVARQKFRRVSMLRARTDHPESVAGVVFNRVLYGESHPYGRPPEGTPETVGAVTREDLVKFHKQVFVPGNAAVVVVGDTTADAIAPAVEAALKGWPGGKAPAVDLPKPPPRPEGVQLYLVDKPSAAQSVLRIGQVGVPRKHPDYVALTVMNAVLGGQFSSRINLNLREDKGFTYGAGSGYDFRVGPGPFEAETSVATPVTKESLAELIKELTEFGSTRPVTDQELAFAKDRIICGFPSQFQTTAGVASSLAELFVYDLPDDDLTRYPARVEALTRADVERAARDHLDPKRLTVVVVGDRAKVEGPLKTLPFVKEVRLVDDQGNPAGAPHARAGKNPVMIGDE
ncbi:MAG: insulinase family protein [Isosphaeraceae bacterium]